MPKYKVTWEDTIKCFMVLEAGSEEDAVRKAREEDFTADENETRDTEPGYQPRKFKAYRYD